MELIIWLLALSIGINLLLFLFAYYEQTDKLTDIAYSISFLAVGMIAYAASAMTFVNLIAMIMVILWSVRIGTFLFTRILRIGEDKRFNSIRKSFKKFGMFWLAQGFSVWTILLPALLLFYESPEKFETLSVVGITIWLIGLLLETFADKQKRDFSNDPKNKNKWIEKGLWNYSRHPNYLGEILVWVGLYLSVLPYLSLSLALIGLVSPIWIVVLLTSISGIPPTEKSADKKWGKDKGYQKYKQRVPVLIPRFIRS